MRHEWVLYDFGLQLLQEESVLFLQAVVQYPWHLLSPDRWLFGLNLTAGQGRYSHLYFWGNLGRENYKFSTKDFTIWLYENRRTSSVTRGKPVLSFHHENTRVPLRFVRYQAHSSLQKQSAIETAEFVAHTLSFESGLREHRWRLILSWLLYIIVRRCWVHPRPPKHPSQEQRDPCCCTPT